MKNNVNNKNMNNNKNIKMNNNNINNPSMAHSVHMPLICGPDERGVADVANVE